MGEKLNYELLKTRSDVFKMCFLTFWPKAEGETHYFKWDTVGAKYIKT